MTIFATPSQSPQSCSKISNYDSYNTEKLKKKATLCNALQGYRIYEGVKVVDRRIIIGLRSI